MRVDWDDLVQEPEEITPLRAAELEVSKALLAAAYERRAERIRKWRERLLTRPLHNKRVISQDEVAVWRIMYEDGMTLEEIAKGCGVGTNTVCRNLNKGV